MAEVSRRRSATSPTSPGLRERVLTDDASVLSFLPLSYILARVVALRLVRPGLRTVTCPAPGGWPRKPRHPSNPRTATEPR